MTRNPQTDMNRYLNHEGPLNTHEQLSARENNGGYEQWSCNIYRVHRLGWKVQFRVCICRLMQFQGFKVFGPVEVTYINKKVWLTKRRDDCIWIWITTSAYDYVLNPLRKVWAGEKHLERYTRFGCQVKRLSQIQLQATVIQPFFWTSHLKQT